MTDLDIGMNQRLCEPLAWDDSRTLRPRQGDDRRGARGRQGLRPLPRCRRRRHPVPHPVPARTRARARTSRAAPRAIAYARYSEAGPDYLYNMQRLLKKFETAKELVPQPVLRKAARETRFGAIFYGSTSPAMHEALDALQAQDIISTRCACARSRSATRSIDFVAEHEKVFVVEQNRDAQLRTLLSTSRDRSGAARSDPALRRHADHRALHHRGDRAADPRRQCRADRGATGEGGMSRRAARAVRIDCDFEGPARVGVRTETR